MAKKTTTQMLIEELEDLKMKLFDKESSLLRTYADNNVLCDLYGQATREVAETRKYIELLDRTITMIREGEKK
jgi:hypothetical protein